MPDVSEVFECLLANLKVVDADQIKGRRDEITKSLNKYFRGTDSVSANRLMVGSWGRHTAINGVSDLDMIYILPASMKEDLHKEGGTSKALHQTKDAIAAHYSQTDIRVDRLVVVVQFRNYKFEVQPCFERSDGSFEYPDTYSDTWKRTDPRAEIEAISNLNENTGGKARNLCRLARAWKRKHNVDMGGLLIDTLVWRFLTSTSNTNALTTHYDRLVLDFFRFLAELPKQQTWNALGSNQKVKVKKNFQAKARKAFNLCEEAIAGEGTASMPAKWRKVFGRFIPTTFATNSIEETEPYNDTEEFIEDLYPINLQYHLRIDCTVTQDGWRPTLLSTLLLQKSWLLPSKKLRFHITSTDTPQPYEVRWKVLNQGDEAERRNMIRGQIVESNTANPSEHTENTQFRGNHYVECYLIRNGEVVARAGIEVPITTT